MFWNLFSAPNPDLVACGENRDYQAELRLLAKHTVTTGKVIAAACGKSLTIVVEMNNVNPQ